MNRISKEDIVTQQFTVESPSELLEFLIEKGIRKSKNAIQSVLKHRLILVNGKVVTQYNHSLKRGDKVSVMKFDQKKKLGRLQGLSIIYEDESIIVINKDSGLLSVATEREKVRTATAVLTNYVQKRSRTAKIFVLHRLDREASGLMLFAKSIEIQHAVKNDWDKYVLSYNFAIIVEGIMPKESGELRTWLTQNRNYQVFSSTFDNGGQEAISSYKVVKANERYSLVDFKQKTRLRNQLRAQLQQLQRPIVGDRKYGATSSPIKRVAMHVNEVKLKHPMTGKVLIFEAPIPKAMISLIK